jgi:penicillin-insensitive murein endopeptidase
MTQSGSRTRRPTADVISVLQKDTCPFNCAFCLWDSLLCDTTARVIGFYSKGCLAGAKALPINGKTWQVMRLSRNRNWCHPSLVQFLERLADKGPKVGWRGLLVGDLSQARGGPMLTGHSSHQIGLDADIWLTPMPLRELTRREREEMSARSWPYEAHAAGERSRTGPSPAHRSISL